MTARRDQGPGPGVVAVLAVESFDRACKTVAANGLSHAKRAVGPGPTAGELDRECRAAAGRADEHVDVPAQGIEAIIGVEFLLAIPPDLDLVLVVGEAVGAHSLGECAQGFGSGDAGGGGASTLRS